MQHDQMAAYNLTDPSYRFTTETHAVSAGQCPVCKVIWAQRPDQSCDCFFLGPQVINGPDWDQSRLLVQAIQSPRPLTSGEAL